MSEPFSEKLAFVLKVLSVSRARLASELGVDKSVVARWMNGAVKPSADNLARLSALVASRSPGFTSLDWDRDIESIGAWFGVRPSRTPGGGVADLRAGLPLPFLAQALAKTALYGAAYEGFFRSTRPFAQLPARFVHDGCMVRKDDSGLLRVNLATGGVFVDGWLLPLQNQLFLIGSEFNGGGLAFGVLNGVYAARVDVIDGLILAPVQDADRTPTAWAIVWEREGDLTGDQTADDARFNEMAAGEWLAPEGSISLEMIEHLTRDIGPGPLAAGGDWLLRMPPSRSMSRGKDEIGGQGAAPLRAT
ncbi:MAG TPA: helix-turn-helix transcriptional regulator [Caulobacteraceae bacterium]|nr:helix-turn-helix transcriptional regulator [Caulobacteraceae bacterium]